MASSCPYLAQFDRHVVSSPAHLLEGREEIEIKVIYNVNGLVSTVLVAVESYYTNFSKCGPGCYSCANLHLGLCLCF